MKLVIVILLLIVAVLFWWYFREVRRLEIKVFMLDYRINTQRRVMDEYIKGTREIKRNEC